MTSANREEAAMWKCFAVLSWMVRVSQDVQRILLNTQSGMQA